MPTCPFGCGDEDVTMSEKKKAKYDMQLPGGEGPH